MVYLLFVCSGLSGLIYQVVWVRAFGNVFGNTIHSASLVVAVFMLGLGLGSYAGGAWADRRAVGRPGLLLHAFGSIELAIGALALAVSLLLPHLSSLSASISSYVRGPEGWYELSTASHLGRVALAAVLLTPITMLMGATLTLLIRHVVARDLDMSGWRIALLYAANTAGAAIGCFLTDFALVPAYGLRGTQMVAFGFNMMAALGAFRLTRDAARGQTNGGGAVVERRLPPSRDLPQSGDDERRLVAATSAAIALSGFAAMGLEIVWFRHFSILLGEYRSVFSLLLTIVLCGIGAGSLAGGWLVRRTKQPAHVWMLVQGGFVAATLLGLSLVDARTVSAAARNAGDLVGWARTWSELWFNAKPILIVAAVPALLMGFAFPVANALVQRVESRVGRRAGVLYLANTAGAVGGSLAAGFVLLPGLGIQASTTVLTVIAAGAIVPLHLGDRSRAHGRRFAGSLIAAAAAIGIWIALPSDFLISRELLFPVDKTYALSEGLTEVIAVTEGPNGGRVLVTNGHPMSSTELFSQRYMRGMAHIPLLSFEKPEHVLVLCYGVGNTAHAATLHPSVHRVDVVDLSKHVLEHSGYFREFNHDVLRDPRVTVYINDGRHHLQMSAPESYDLITLEPPPIVHAGVASLYSRDFYASARSRLTPRGFITQWLPVFGVPHDVILSMVRAFVEVFPTAVLLSGANTNLLLVGTRDAHTAIDPDRVAAALSAAPAVQADLQRVELGTVREIVGAFVAPADTLIAATRNVAPVTDDRPIQEYGKRSLMDFGEGGIPPALVDVRRVASWCPGCFADGEPIRAVEGLDTYLALTELAYRAPPAAATNTISGRTIAGSGYLGAIVPESPELRRLLADAANKGTEPDEATGEEVRARYARATVLLEKGQFSQAESEFRAVLQLAPDSVEALNNMGVTLASLGRLDEAVDMFRRALALRPDFADARRNLAFALEKRR